MRYILGTSIGAISIITVQPTPGKTDLVGPLVSATPSEIVLNFPPYSADAANVPAETRIYFLPSGQTTPGTADEWIASAYPFSVTNAPIDPAGNAAYTLPAPVAPVGDYVGQVIHGYTE